MTEPLIPRTIICKDIVIMPGDELTELMRELRSTYDGKAVELPEKKYTNIKFNIIGKPPRKELED